MSTKSRLANCLDNYKTNLEVANKFVAKYPQLHDFVMSITVTHEGGCSIQTWADKADKIAEVFGKDGWTATPDYLKAHYDWSKVVDGVEINIYHMEEIPPPITRSVSPKDWPIQLLDKAPEPIAVEAPLF